MTTTVSKPAVRIHSSRFGAIEVDDELVITLPRGIIGFESCRRFVILDLDGQNPIRWLQSLDNGAVAFPIIDPWRFRPGYAPTISDADATELQVSSAAPKLVFAIVTIPRDDPRRMTANLLGPVVVNPVNRIGKQVIVLDEEYTTRHPILDEMARFQKVAAAAA